MTTLARPVIPKAVSRHSRDMSAMSEVILRRHTKGVFVYFHSHIKLGVGGKGYLPWLSDGPSFSGQGVPVLGPSLPSSLGWKIKAADSTRWKFFHT